MKHLHAVKPGEKCSFCLSPGGEHESWCLHKWKDLLEKDGPLRRQSVIYREIMLHQPFGKGGDHGEYTLCTCNPQRGLYFNHGMHQAQMVELALQKEERETQEEDLGGDRPFPSE